MIVKIVNELAARYIQCHHVVSIRTESPNANSLFIGTGDKHAEHAQDGTQLLIYPLDTEERKETAIYVRCPTYLMNDDGKTIERLF